MSDDIWAGAKFDHLGRVIMDEPTPAQLEQWRIANEENQKLINAGHYDYPDPRAEKLKELEGRLERLEAFLVL